MYLLTDIIKVLNCDTFHTEPNFHNEMVVHAMACDLMSDVLLEKEELSLLITSLATEQSLRTADVISCPTVLIVNSKPIPTAMVTLAQNLKINLFRTDFHKYEAVLEIGKLTKQ